MRNRATLGGAALLAVAACTPHYQITMDSGANDPLEPRPPVSAAAPAGRGPAGAEDAPPASPWAARVLPFDRSDGDRPFLGTGFTGYAAVPAETGYTQGVRVAGVQPKQALAIAGLADGDVIVAFAGRTLDGPQAELIQQLREILKGMAPDTPTSLAYYRKDEGITEVDFWLGRGPPPFARLETPPGWFEPTLAGLPLRDPEIEAWIAAALALDGGEERAADTTRRQRERFEKRDPFRLREAVVAQMFPSAQEQLADRMLSRLARRVIAPAEFAGIEWTVWTGVGRVEIEPLPDWDAHLDVIERQLVSLYTWLTEQLADWTPQERAWLAENFVVLSDRTLVEGEYIYGDEDVERERTNRRIVEMLERVDRAALAINVDNLMRFLDAYGEEVARAAEKDGRDGLLASRDTPAGRIEIWGGGSQTHTTRCAFRYDHGGNDRYLDTAGRADLTQPVSINVDHAGDDLYAATTPFCQGAALGGVGILIDDAGDDQYLAAQWSQGAAVAGVGLLLDASGDDTYRGREACQGVALVGGATLADDAGDDVYTADRFSKGVGFAAGVGALRDKDGDDRYSCTAEYRSEYGEDGVFSGWGQGVGFGFRHVASGGIGILHDARGDDVYEAGNFSQGGAYFFAWGILRDDAGNDRYIGSRYAQGYAAHQAAGTFIDGGGDDLYQSHSGVAQGLSWDETSVFFRDRGGNDRYETRGFSLASAAHNGIVIFIDDDGDDTYADLPAKANSNNYHGGRSFALFVDRAGADHYRGRADDDWNGRAFWRDDGAYFLDLDGDRPLAGLVRDAAAEQ